ncbi:ABC transporter B family member 5 [Gracilariopsis chorda]|uniref:Probable ATP-dependent transporter ycf16 n=1 Tax=Gracilariopsis chorda TaxID=448386 RepID=A0A2V3IY88_9FLOR|nr:ABC transporter B family member 5 [Gracilariopsis chorda]|eukprot:PXF46647.1 ABC transporter B family member 5 [Gracilariopsis chorda]
MPSHFGLRSRRRSATERTPLVGSGTQNDGIEWREVFRVTRPYMFPSTLKLRFVAVVTLVMIMLSKLLALVPPYAYKLAVDAFANNLLGGPPIIPYAAVFLYVGARLLADLTSALQSYCFNLVTSDCTNTFAIDIFAHLQRLSLAFHLQRKTGEVTRIVDRGTRSIQVLMSTLLTTLFPVAFQVSFVTAIFLKLGTPMIALVILITVAVYFVYTIWVTQWRTKLRRDYIDADNKLSDKAVDTLINFETVKMFGMENEEASLYGQYAVELRHQSIRTQASLSILNFGQSFIQRIGLLCTMLLAARGIVYGGLTAGDFVLINTYVGQIFQPLFFLGVSYRVLSQAATDLEKTVALMNEEITVKDREDAKRLTVHEEDILAGKVGDLKFENVSFQYTGSERGSNGGLRKISFHVPPGKMVALVGSSGAGKSTIMRLLLRFYDVDSGRILIDGKDIRSFSQESLRKNVGVVAQDTVLFNQTLRYNISYGKQDATEAEILAAARAAALGPFIESLPLGLDTVVGERGVRLSGGERQRVGCARCLIKSPAFVLLDEATSALDTHTERELQENLREVCKNRTTVVVAHRLSTVMMADEIIVLGKDPQASEAPSEGDQAFDPEEGFDQTTSTGVIIERGNHRELLQRSGVYAEMWQAQFRVERENVQKMENTEDDM